MITKVRDKLTFKRGILIREGTFTSTVLWDDTGDTKMVPKSSIESFIEYSEEEEEIKRLQEKDKKIKESNDKRFAELTKNMSKDDLMFLLRYFQPQG